MREIKRNMARENMKKYGFTRINKKRRYNRSDGKVETSSFFARNWKKWVHGKPSKKQMLAV